MQNFTFLSNFELFHFDHPDLHGSTIGLLPSLCQQDGPIVKQ